MLFSNGDRRSPGGGGMKRYRPHLLVLCVLAVVLLTGMHSALQNALADMRFNWYHRQASGNIVLVAIDPASIDKIGVWPWPRQLHAELIDRLESAGASNVVFDVDFSSASNSTSDQNLADALQRAGGSVVLPTFEQFAQHDGHRTLHVSRPLPQFAERSWSAIVNVPVDPDGLVRRYSFGRKLDGRFLPSLGAFLAGHTERSQASGRIDFGISRDSLPVVSYADVVRGDSSALKKLKNKNVIIGATAIELGDRFNVPGGQVIPGPMLQMLAAESILQGRMLHVSSDFVTLGGLGFIILLMVYLWRRYSAGARVAVLVGLAIASELGAVLLQAKLAIILDTSLWYAAIAAYLAALALDEIDFRELLSRIGENRFQRIAMSLGDGLVCADRNGLITVWNPGAVAIFGYQSEDMIGQPFGRICGSIDDAGKYVPFSILDLPLDELQAAGGKVMELEGLRKNGEGFPLEACFSQWQGIDGSQYGVVLRDISIRKREAQRIRHLALCDTLTGLANRNALNEHLSAKFSEAKTAPCEIALLLIDLDKFKEVNDTLGHACGDEMLFAVAERLNSLVKGAGLVARLSGDEFAVVLSGNSVADRAEALAEQTSSAFRKTPLEVGVRSFDVGVSIGVAIYPKDCATSEELLGNADLALYRAKATGRGRYVFFERKLRDELETRLSLEADLQRATLADEFELFYQPQVDLEDGRIVGAEALIRWRHPALGIVTPDEFMPVVNASSISSSVASWVMKTVCMQGRRWQQMGHDVRLAINLAPSQFQSGDLAATVSSVLKETGFSPSLLELEVTEGILLEDDERACEIFRRIQSLGVNIAFDDFGTGYASLTYLKKFALNTLKIDKSFVIDLRADSDDMVIVGATIGLGKLLGLSVIAEGIEDRATADLLWSMGCKEGQGYYFGRPMPAAEFERKFLLGDALPTSGLAEAEPAANAA
jgi:diguanylate cyclase (GGDEF)-like protein/PAS domain S-box-containing protein